MLPRINGKSIIDCDINDLQVIIDNPSFAENEYLDYKKSFAIDVVPKGQKAQEQIEFRNDVCAFANAQGGYLIYGVEEEKGIPTKITGICIKENNRDSFEREIKNYLQSIKPRIPYYKISFISVKEDKYVVILLVQHDYFAPYVQLVEEKSYQFYKRIGNAKSYIEYQELRTMFTQSLSLEKEIEKLREERTEFFLSQEDDSDNSFSQFILLHIIPDTFLDANYNKPVFAMRQTGSNISIAFNSFYCNSNPYPMAEGLRYLDRDDSGKAECRLYNNGIAEFFCPLKRKRLLCTKDKTDYIIRDALWNMINGAVDRYIGIVNQVIEAKRIFVCLSVIGCKNAITDDCSFYDYVSKIDRARLLCDPVVFENIENRTVNTVEKARFQLVYLTSLGIINDPQLQDLIKTVYGDVDVQVQYSI